MCTVKLEMTLVEAKKLYPVSDESFKKRLVDEFGINHFKKLSGNIMKRVTTMDDVFEELGINKEEWLKQREYLDTNELGHSKVQLIIKCFNEGWIPDWKNSSEYKYFPWFTMSGASGVGFSFSDCDHQITCSDVGVHLCLKTTELATFVGQTFLEEYKEWMVK